MTSPLLIDFAIALALHAFRPIMHVENAGSFVKNIFFKSLYDGTRCFFQYLVPGGVQTPVCGNYDPRSMPSDLELADVIRDFDHLSIDENKEVEEQY